MSNAFSNKAIYKTFFLLFCLAALGFTTNYFLAKTYIPEAQLTGLHYSILQLYLIFTICSFVILGILLIVRKKNLDNVGYTFLLLTSVKMGAAYFLLRPILRTVTQGFSFEKTNFFIIFIYFLAIETLLTIRILNNKQ